MQFNAAIDTSVQINLIMRGEKNRSLAWLFMNPSRRYGSFAPRTGLAFFAIVTACAARFLRERP
jgi:hypothetical protein